MQVLTNWIPVRTSQGWQYLSLLINDSQRLSRLRSMSDSAGSKPMSSAAAEATQYSCVSD